MNMKLVGIVGFVVTNLVLVASGEETVAQRIARKSRENRIAENMPIFNFISRQMHPNDPVDIDYETIRYHACFSKYESKRNYFREMHANLPVEYRLHALEQVRRDIAKIVLKNS